MTPAKPPAAVLRALAEGPRGSSTDFPGSSDAALIALCAQVDALELATQDAGQGSNKIEDDDQFDCFVLKQVKKQRPLLAKLHKLHATTEGGILARLRTWVLFEHFYLDNLLASEAINEQLLGLLVRDVRAYGGASSSCHGGNDPDADLIRLCAEHKAMRDAVNEHSTTLDDADPYWVAYDRSRDAITAARPQTLAGLVAKARLARGDHPADLMDDVWAGQVVDDLLSVFGGEG